MKLDILIPVGPGHEELYLRAMDSVRIATMDKGCFDVVSILAGDDLDGTKGRSRTRNELAAGSDADWLFFLDADDLMHPHALRNFACGIEDPEEGALIACFGRICEMKDSCIVDRYQVPEINTRQELIAFDPYTTIQMGHFVQRDAFNELQFREDMNTGEDWEYYLRLWKRPCRKIDKPFMINVKGSHSTGPRSATGQEWNRVVDRLLEEAREG